MKNIARAVFLAFLYVLITTGNAGAQFWKKKKKDNRRTEHPQRNNQGTHKPAASQPVKPKVTPAKAFEYPETQYKERYRIDLLAPFYLAELVQDGKVTVKNRLPEKVLPALSFYEGLILATDTLKKLGYEFDIYVYDVTDDLESPQTLVNTDAFKGSDLIVAVLSSNDFPLIAKYAKKQNINLISALSPSDQGVSDNPYFTMLQPRIETHCAALEGFIRRKHDMHVQPIMLYRTAVPIDSFVQNVFIQSNAFTYRRVLCNDTPSPADIAPLLTNQELNVVLMPIMSDRYAEMLMMKLHEWFPGYDFEVWGMPSWTDMNSLKRPDAYPNVAVHFTSAHYFDQSTALGQAISQAYRKKYGGKPDNLVFRGYETMFWYAYMLKKYGTIFNRNFWDNSWAPFTRFEIKPNLDKDGNIIFNENKHVYLYRYQSSSYMVEQ